MELQSAVPHVGRLDAGLEAAPRDVAARTELARIVGDQEIRWRAKIATESALRCGDAACCCSGRAEAAMRVICDPLLRELMTLQAHNRNDQRRVADTAGLQSLRQQTAIKGNRAQESR